MNLKAFLNALTGKQESKDIAKERLRLVLVHDRATVSPEFLDKIKEEMIAVISKYLEIDENNTEVNMHKSDGTAVLEANLAVKAIRRNA
ncbi:cell division topological specificity factor MinE [Dethiobacter alkaliphilus]|uniref:cell division topological specificity factor MinE n=1 Tax=Dethiobacter alkaliphilus TaxID=427926 RepID=UPI0022266EBD|nr:cell division topological specificity factor MinE [Dethiobacter alkaliphilus]MCW3491347.1 cell division topological specificity factor MinE [Dethiobacter alkaliphilus]